MCKGLRPQKLKNKTPNKVSLHKSHKECFDSIKEMWEQCYYMQDNYTEKPKTTTEISEIQAWSDVTLDNTQEYEFQTEVNEVYQHYWKYPPPNNQFGFHRPPENRFQGNKFQKNRNGQPGSNHFNVQRLYSQRHQNTTVANQSTPQCKLCTRQLQYGTNEPELGTPTPSEPILPITLQLPIW